MFPPQKCIDTLVPFLDSFLTSPTPDFSSRGFWECIKIPANFHVDPTNLRNGSVNFPEIWHNHHIVPFECPRSDFSIESIERSFLTFFGPILPLFFTQKITFGNFIYFSVYGFLGMLARYYQVMDALECSKGHLLGPK